MSRTPAYDLAPTPVARKLLELYMRDLGLTEEPAGSNKGPQIKKFLDGWKGRYGIRYAKGARWCGLCCEYLTREAYDALGITPCPLDRWHSLGGSSNWIFWAKKFGALLTPAEVLPGDVAVIYHPDNPETVENEEQGHVCVVAAPIEGGEVVSLDGNRGHTVAWAVRDVGKFTAFVRLPER